VVRWFAQPIALAIKRVHVVSHISHHCHHLRHLSPNFHFRHSPPPSMISSERNVFHPIQFLCHRERALSLALPKYKFFRKALLKKKTSCFTPKKQKNKEQKNVHGHFASVFDVY
jgi:hypothetical protein